MDLIAITETWLTINDSAVKAELCPDGYKLMEHPRTLRRGGGTGLLFRDTLTVKIVAAGEKDSYEFAEWIVSSPPHKIRLVIVYRPPYSENHQAPTNVFIDEISDYLESLLLYKEQLLVTGDFNFHIDKLQDPDSLKFLDLLRSFGLQQHVTEATQLHGHILDLLITRVSDNLVHGVPLTLIDRYISDHAIIMCWRSLCKPELSVKTITYRKLNTLI